MLKIAGDINLTDNYFDVGFGIGSQLAQGFDPFAHLGRREDDLWIGNFEGVTADVTNKSGAAALQFRVSPKSLKHLRHMDVYGFANNHAMQHGTDAYRQTVETLEKQGAKCFGMDDRRSVVVEHQGRQISLTGFSQRIDAWGEKPLYWHNPEYWELEGEVRNLPKEAFKIAYVHWGNEFVNYPSSQQKRFAHWLVDAGYDLIIGMHPHILQGHEVYSGRHIFYSLGNFVFDMAWEPTHYGLVVSVDFKTAQPQISWQYVRIGEDFSPTFINKENVPMDYRMSHLAALIQKEENSEEYHNAINGYYKQYRKANHSDIMGKMLAHPAIAVDILKDYAKRRILK